MARGAVRAHRSILLALALWGALLGLPRASVAQESITLQLDWTWWAGLIPFHVAQEKGFFGDAGLSVAVQQGQGAASTVTVVGGGKAPIGHANQAVTAQFVSKGVPVTAVSAFWQRTTLGLLGLDNTTIKVPKDIEGKRVGSTPTGVDPQVLPAFVGANNVDLSKVQIVNMPGEAKFAALMAGKVDLISADIPRFAILARAQGRKANELYFADWGVNLLSYGIIVNNAFLREKPDVVRRFLAATLKAYDYTFRNTDEAIEIFIKRTGDTLPKAQHKAELLVYQQNLHTENTQGKPLGWQSDRDWDRMLSTLEKYGGMTNRRPASEYFTNEYLPAN